MRLNEVIRITASSYGEDFTQPYNDFTFNGVTYGKLPVLTKPEFIGLATYPIFDEEYRGILNGKIVDEYFLREIGGETIDEFMLMMRRKMDQIMPYYNKLYASEQIPYSALDTMKIDSVSRASMDSVETSGGDTIASTDSTSKGRAVNSSTPQTQLQGNEDYATSAADSNSTTAGNSNTNTTQSGESNTENESESHVTGYQGIASDLIMRYRGSLLNIDTLILNDLQDCFMMILNSGDSYTRQLWY